MPLTVRPYEPTDEEKVLALLRTALGPDPSGDPASRFFRWKHEENPFGRSLALVAQSEGRLVGFRTFMRWRFRSPSGPVRAVRAVDTATHPDYQGQGIFSHLTRAALSDLRGEVDLIFNTPNHKSLPGYLKMGWKPVGTVPIAIRPVRPWRFARGLAGAARARSPHGDRRADVCSLPPAREVLRSADGVQGLLDAARSTETRLHTDRAAAYLSWRYAYAPRLDYRAAVVEDGGDLTGLAIGRSRARGVLREFTLAELIVRRGDRATARALLRLVRRGCGADHVATHLAPGTEAAQAGARAGYLSLPSRGITLVALPLAAVTPPPSSLTSWCLSLGDLEVF